MGDYGPRDLSGGFRVGLRRPHQALPGMSRSSSWSTPLAPSPMHIRPVPPSLSSDHSALLPRSSEFWPGEKLNAVLADSLRHDLQRAKRHCVEQREELSSHAHQLSEEAQRLQQKVAIECAAARCALPPLQRRRPAAPFSLLPDWALQHQSGPPALSSTSAAFLTSLPAWSVQPNHQVFSLSPPQTQIGRDSFARPPLAATADDRSKLATLPQASSFYAMDSPVQLAGLEGVTAKLISQSMGSCCGLDANAGASGKEQDNLQIAESQAVQSVQPPLPSVGIGRVLNGTDADAKRAGQASGSQRLYAAAEEEYSKVVHPALAAGESVSSVDTSEQCTSTRADAARLKPANAEPEDTSTPAAAVQDGSSIQPAGVVADQEVLADRSTESRVPQSQPLQQQQQQLQLELQQLEPQQQQQPHTSQVCLHAGVDFNKLVTEASKALEGFSGGEGEDDANSMEEDEDLLASLSDFSSLAPSPISGCDSWASSSSDMSPDPENILVDSADYETRSRRVSKERSSITETQQAKSDDVVADPLTPDISSRTTAAGEPSATDSELVDEAESQAKRLLECQSDGLEQVNISVEQKAADFDAWHKRVVTDMAAGMESLRSAVAEQDIALQNSKEAQNRIESMMVELEKPIPPLSREELLRQVPPWIPDPEDPPPPVVEDSDLKRRIAIVFMEAPQELKGKIRAAMMSSPRGL